MSSSSPPSFHTLLSDIRALYTADKHLAAARKLDALRTALASSPSFAPSPSPSSETRLASTTPTGPVFPATVVTDAEAVAARAELQTPFFRRVAAECAEVLQLRSALHSREGWTLSYDGAETKVWYRREPHTASHTILTEGTIRAPLLNVAALICEADLYPSLFWYITQARELSLRGVGTSRMKRAAHLVVYAPWPLCKRDSAVYAYGVDALDEDKGCVMVVSRSARESDGLDPEDIAETSKTVRIDMHGSGFELVPSAPGVVKVRFLFNVDPHMAFVPVALINWAARMLCRWSLRMLESRARDLSKMPKAYDERITKEPFYEFVRNRQAEFWERKGYSPQNVQLEEGKVCLLRRLSDNFDPEAAPTGPPASLVKSLVRGERSGEVRETPKGRGTLSRMFAGSNFR